jgi:hypothetical protein
MANLVGDASDPNVAAVHGKHASTASGVFGESDVGPGVHGVSRGTDPNQMGVGVFAEAEGTGVFAVSKGFMGVFATSASSTGGHGVMGQATGGGAGVVGESTKGIGVFGSTETGETAIKGVHKGQGLAGFFEGHVSVTRSLNVNGDVSVSGDVALAGADVAEQFGVSGGVDVAPGCVVVLDGDDRVRVSDKPYDRRVAGVVSGAGHYRPAVVLDHVEGDAARHPVAMTGKVWCLVEADSSPVGVGDLLTSSPVAGHAMRATDERRAFGAVIGKSLRPLKSGRGLVPVLVALQ